MGVMEVSLLFFLGLAMFLTVVVVVVGVISFGVNSDFYSKHSNYLMRARVILQGLALALLAAILWLAAF